jgi:hypothetical protein
MPDHGARQLISRSVVPPTFIRFAVRRKNGTASRMKELYALKVSCISDHGVEPRLDRKNRDAGEAERECDRHAQEHRKKKAAKQDERRHARRQGRRRS